MVAAQRQDSARSRRRSRCPQNIAKAGVRTLPDQRRRFKSRARYQRYLLDLKCTLRIARPNSRATFDMALSLDAPLRRRE
jgi:hypothetical protein